MKLKFILPFLFFVFVAGLLWRGLSLHPNQIPSPLIGKPAPTFDLPTLLSEKSTTTNTDFLGHVTVVNVWATWCYACELEHAFLMRVAQDKQVMLYGLNYKDDPIAARKWLSEQGNPYQIIAVDAKGRAAIDWGVYGTPEMFVVDKKGVIRHKIMGPIDQDMWVSEILPLIQKLEAEA